MEKDLSCPSEPERIIIRPPIIQFLSGENFIPEGLRAASKNRFAQEKEVTIFFLYHYPCADGIFAALAARLSYGLSYDIGKEKCQFIPHTIYGGRKQSDELLEKMSSGDVVYLLDYLGEGDFPKRVSQKVKRLVILDHHKTGIEYMDAWAAEDRGNLPDNVHAVMDPNKSGATLAFNEFLPLMSEELRILFAYVEDNDLWKHELPFSKEFSHGLFSLKLEYDYQKNPDIFKQLNQLDFAKVASKGALLIDERDKKIRELITQRKLIHLSDGDGHYKCYSADADGHEVISELGQQLAELSAKDGLDPLGAVCLRTQGNEEVRVSLRSCSKTFDTTKISKFYNGGGHAAASGFVTTKQMFDGFVQGEKE